MKRKTFGKKLMLHKNTVADLNKRDMDDLKGAGVCSTEPSSCVQECSYTCGYTCEPMVCTLSDCMSRCTSQLACC